MESGDTFIEHMACVSAPWEATTPHTVLRPVTTARMVFEDELLTLRTLVMIDEGGYGMSYISLDDGRLSTFQGLDSKLSAGERSSDVRSLY